MNPASTGPGGEDVKDAAVREAGAHSAAVTWQEPGRKKLGWSGGSGRCGLGDHQLGREIVLAVRPATGPVAGGIGREPPKLLLRWRLTDAERCHLFSQHRKLPGFLVPRAAWPGQSGDAAGERIGIGEAGSASRADTDKEFTSWSS